MGIHLVKEIAAQQEQSVEQYHILLILTDGVIEDMDDSKLAIIEASRHPMSIIIVGVGAADFKPMEVLDGDTGLLSHNGLTAEHDIVQFVPYNKFEGDYASEDLAHEVLREVPTQLVSYMASRGIQPGQKPQPRSDIQPLIKDTVKQKHHKTPTHRRESMQWNIRVMIVHQRVHQRVHRQLIQIRVRIYRDFLAIMIRTDRHMKGGDAIPSKK